MVLVCMTAIAVAVASIALDLSTRRILKEVQKLHRLQLDDI